MGGDTHIMGIHTASRALAVNTAMCFPCGCSDPTWRSFSKRTLRLTFPRALVPLLPRHSEGCGPGFAKGSVSGGRDRRCLISAFTWQVQCLVPGLGSTRCGFFRPDRGINITHSVSDATEFPWKGTFGYDCNLGSLKRERTLRPRPYLLRPCRWLAQTLI